MEGIVFIALSIIVTCSCFIPCLMYIICVRNRQEIQTYPDTPMQIRIIERSRVDEPKVDDPCQV